LRLKKTSKIFEKTFQLTVEMTLPSLLGHCKQEIRRNTYSGKIKKAAAYAGVKDLDDIHPHTLRACAAGNAYRKSGNVKVVQSLLGHRNPEMTYKYIKNIDAFDSLKAIL